MPSLEHAAHHSVWDEPTTPVPSDAPHPVMRLADHERCSGCGYSLVGFSTDAVCPECGLPIDLRRANYASWVEMRARTVTPMDTWVATGAVALASGPLAILTAFWGSLQLGDPVGVFSAIGAAPAVEEVGKVVAPLMLIESRPWMFRSRKQIVAACLVSAFAFASIENMLYLGVYLPSPSPRTVLWRWTACVALHLGCTAIASIGLCRLHREMLVARKRSRLEIAVPYLAAAILLHAAYNAFALVLHFSGAL